MPLHAAPRRGRRHACHSPFRHPCLCPVRRYTLCCSLSVSAEGAACHAPSLHPPDRHVDAGEPRVCGLLLSAQCLAQPVERAAQLARRVRALLNALAHVLQHGAQALCELAEGGLHGRLNGAAQQLRQLLATQRQGRHAAVPTLRRDWTITESIDQFVAVAG
eukprot:351140-Chlamydomonas_euryale.AAC.7